nr:PREDICTED: uncharacterized protein LOC103280681 [Anolis carolinensis]|eukprot:XP_008118672.2 PREDICTED: uncharacterized protein LOC103280681 [Anolis carolinensis]
METALPELQSYVGQFLEFWKRERDGDKTMQLQKRKKKQDATWRGTLAAGVRSFFHTTQRSDSGFRRESSRPALLCRDSRESRASRERTEAREGRKGEREERTPKAGASSFFSSPSFFGGTHPSLRGQGGRREAGGVGRRKVTQAGGGGVSSSWQESSLPIAKLPESGGKEEEEEEKKEPAGVVLSFLEDSRRPMAGEEGSRAPEGRRGAAEDHRREGEAPTEMRTGPFPHSPKQTRGFRSLLPGHLAKDPLPPPAPCPFPFPMAQASPSEAGRGKEEEGARGKTTRGETEPQTPLLLRSVS